MDIKIINSKKIALRRKVGHLEMKKKLDPQDPNYVKDNSRGFQMEKKLVSSKKLASARKVGHLKKSYISKLARRRIVGHPSLTKNFP